VSSLGGRIYYPKNNEWPSRFEQPLRATEPIAAFLRSRGDVERIDVNRSDVPMNFGDYHRIEEMSSHGASMLTSLFLMRFWEPRARQLFGVNYYVGRTPSQPDQVDIFTAPSGIKVFSNPNGRPRVWSVHRVLRSRGYTQGREMLSHPSFDMSTTAFMDAAVPTLEECGSPDDVELVKRDWFSVTIRARMACRGMVVLNDNFYPGWRARVDGRSTQIYPAYMCLRGVVVESGTHLVEIRYRPRAFYLGLLLFVIGSGGAVILFRRNESSGVNLVSDGLTQSVEELPVR
jgi:hypothetical protein